MLKPIPVELVPHDPKREVKARCRDCHPDDSYAYGDCKNAWIRRIEKDALNWLDQY